MSGITERITGPIYQHTVQVDIHLTLDEADAIASALEYTLLNKRMSDEDVSSVSFVATELRFLLTRAMKRRLDYE